MVIAGTQTKTRQLITHTLAFFFIFSSLAYACPDLNSITEDDRDSSVAATASDKNPCHDADHDSNPLCQYILHDRIGYRSPDFPLAKVITQLVFCRTQITGEIEASVTPFRTATAAGFNFKIPLTLLHHILRV